MYRTVFLNIGRSILGILIIWFGNDLWHLVVLVLSVFTFAYGCYELKDIEQIETFKNKPDYYLDFTVSFDLLFPIALIALLVAYRGGI
ncbi:MAG: hypothetical protein GF375_05925 [Candidatus Omnitrophica bacterium]|nr:hypothetical protein [Candidatus Omnitrophota bacterium]MBD3269513.1 hypothetical protein [Candidatus Omnitrophota bacterium]